MLKNVFLDVIIGNLVTEYWM